MDQRDTEALIESLSADLEPVRPARPAASTAAIWLGVAWPLVVAVTLLVGPMRDGAFEQLLIAPRYTLEGLLGLAAGISAVLAALRLGTPSSTPVWSRAWPVLALFSAWAGLVAYALINPPIDASMFGKRPHCVVEIFAYSLPAIAIGLVLLRSRATLERRPAVGLLAAASASLPALLMQFACMYDPWHTLTLHIAPVAVVVGLALLVGERLLPKV